MQPHRWISRITLLALFLGLTVTHAQTSQQPLTAKRAALNETFMNTPRPLFFNELQALDSDLHRGLKLPAQRKNFAFAAGAHLLPLTFAEVTQALPHYPLVFVPEGDTIALVALAGLPGAGNRQIDPAGEWRPGVYIPAYVRGYPFITLRPAPGADPILGFDPKASDFKAADGQPLFTAEGQPGEALKSIMAFHAEYRQLAELTQGMTQSLKAAGVLEEGNIKLQSPDGSVQQINGFLVVSEQKLKALSAEALKTLMDNNALGLAYAQLFSMSSLGNLLAPPTEPAPKAKPAKARKSGKTTAKSDSSI